MAFQDDFGSIGGQLRRYHNTTNTSVSFKMQMMDGEARYSVSIATIEDQVFTFISPEDCLQWLRAFKKVIDEGADPLILGQEAERIKLVSDLERLQRRKDKLDEQLGP
jgi:hypothetical protein